MKILIFSGALERHPGATSKKITEHFGRLLSGLGCEVSVFDLAASGVPLFETDIALPRSVEMMNAQFREADHHVWLTPMYHGGMTGVMKNCLDWLEASSRKALPYLTGKRIALVCWADGVQAMQGVNNMDAVAKSLRAWPLPYSVPILRKGLFNADGTFASEYAEKFEMIARLLIKGP